MACAPALRPFRRWRPSIRGVLIHVTALSPRIPDAKAVITSGSILPNRPGSVGHIADSGASEGGVCAACDTPGTLLLLFGSVARRRVAGPVSSTRAEQRSGGSRSFTIRFSAPMVALGEPRARGPFDIALPDGRGAADGSTRTNYVYEFAMALPADRAARSRSGDLAGLDGTSLAGPHAQLCARR